MAQAIEQPGARQSAEYGDRRGEENKLADAVVKGGPGYEGDYDRRDSGQRHDHKSRATLRGNVLARYLDENAKRTTEREDQHDFRQLQCEQRWQVIPRHVRHRDQLAREQFLPWLLEEFGKIDQGADRIERVDDRP